jgi:hypothetical protein
VPLPGDFATKILDIFIRVGATQARPITFEHLSDDELLSDVCSERVTYRLIACDAIHVFIPYLLSLHTEIQF